MYIVPVSGGLVLIAALCMAMAVPESSIVFQLKNFKIKAVIFFNVVKT
jgi:hypothetical protein